MELIRKIISVGSSHAVIIPIEFFESCKNRGKTFSKVKLNIKTDKILIEPIWDEKKGS
ncbi:hypothetical protein ES703_105252 [subsurface metagenome]